MYLSSQPQHALQVLAVLSSTVTLVTLISTIIAWFVALYAGQQRRSAAGKTLIELLQFEVTRIRTHFHSRDFDPGEGSIESLRRRLS